jgi:hypothetical protein
MEPANIPSYRTVDYPLFDDDLEFVYACNCEKCQKLPKPDLGCIRMPPSETTCEDIDAVTLSKKCSVHGYVVRHFLPVLDEAVLQVNWSRLDVTYDLASLDINTCNRLLFDARRVYCDDLKEVVWDEPMDIVCPCREVYKELGATGRVSCEHLKYKSDSEGNIYVCNGYLHAFAMQFNKKLAFMANMRVRLARGKEDERTVGRLQKALDKKKAEIKTLLEAQKKDRGELLDANAELKRTLKATKERLGEAHKRIRLMESAASRKETELASAHESRILLERQVAGCRQCGAPFTSGSWGGCMAGCQHMFCLACAKVIIASRSDDGEASDYVDATHPTRIYAPTAIKPVCPECEFPSEYVTAKEF